MITQSDPTYRVRNVPARLDMRLLAAVLDSSLELHPNSHVDVRSLAPNPRDPETQIATFCVTGPATFKLNKDGRYRLEGQDRLYESLQVDKDFHGFTTLNAPKLGEEYNLDIVAVHGLSGHAFGSFKSGEYMWLRDKIARSLPYARVMTYGYDSAILGTASLQTIENIGTTFKDLLRGVRKEQLRRASARRPIIFIGVSMGGLIIKQAIVRMAKDNDDRDHKVLQSIRGMLFFGVPNQGMKIDHLTSMVQGKPNERLIRSLDPESNSLRRLHDDFCEAAPTYSEVYSFFETMTSRIAITINNEVVWGKNEELLVSQSSATHGRSQVEQTRSYVKPINKPHDRLVKFSSLDEDLYRVMEVLEDLAENASHIVNECSRVMQFYALDNSAQHLLPGEPYWRRLTAKSHYIYGQVCKACCGDDGLVSFDEFKKQFDPGDQRLSPATLRSVWDRVKPESSKIRTSLAMAVLYMLHVERFSEDRPDLISHKLDPERYKLLKRFDDWANCQCDQDCGLQWNFVSDLGLSRPRAHASCRICPVARYLELDPRFLDRRMTWREGWSAWKGMTLFKLTETRWKNIGKKNA